MNDAELLRYSRHILLDELGVAGQERIQKARVLIVGAGGLGSPAALYLAAAGAGTLVLADGDTVELSNLQRQILHTEARIGENKADSARAALAAVNTQTHVVPIARRLAEDELMAEAAKADVILDCSDNFPTRYAVNLASLRRKKPLVSGAAIRFTGQIAVFDPRQPDAPCYHCLFPEGEDATETRCATTGVFAPLTGLVGCMQAGECLKLIAGMGESSSGRFWQVDFLTQRWRESRFHKDPDCAVCGKRQTLMHGV